VGNTLTVKKVSGAIKFSAHGVSDKFCERRNDFPGEYKYSVD
jgi:hypothetical protein